MGEEARVRVGSSVARNHHLVSGSQDLRLDAAVLGRAVGAENGDGVDVGQGTLAVPSPAAVVGTGETRLAGRRGTDRENVLGDRGTVGRAHRAVGELALVATSEYQQVLRVLRRIGGEGGWEEVGQRRQA